MENSRAYIASKAVSAVPPLSSSQKGVLTMNKEVEKNIGNCLANHKITQIFTRIEGQ